MFGDTIAASRRPRDRLQAGGPTGPTASCIHSPRSAVFPGHNQSALASSPGRWPGSAHRLCRPLGVGLLRHPDVSPPGLRWQFTSPSAATDTSESTGGQISCSLSVLHTQPIPRLAPSCPVPDLHHHHQAQACACPRVAPASYLLPALHSPRLPASPLRPQSQR